MIEEETLEVYRLIIADDEVEYEAAGTVTEYLIKRASEYANRLGKKNLMIKDSEYAVDPVSHDHMFIYYCERDFR